VQALAPEETEVTPRLAALVKRDLVRPDQAMLPREDAYRFRHLLVRDAAYDALPKATRADLHRRFSEWLEKHGQSLVELDEILGYHREQAARYLEELGRPDPVLALAAGESLTTAGRRALWRGDDSGAARLLERALTLTRPHGFDLHLELDLLDAIVEPQKQLILATAAAERAAAAGDELGELVVRVAVALASFDAGEGSADELERLAEQALPLVEERSDHRALLPVWHAFSLLAIMQSRFEDVARAAEQLIHHSRLADVYPGHFFGLGSALVWGSRPAAEGLAILEGLEPEAQRPGLALNRAVLLAMLDRFEEARALASAAGERMKELGQGDWTSLQLALIAELAEDYEQAAIEMGLFCDSLEGLGRTAELSTFAPVLARYLCALGRYEEAEPLAIKGRELGDPRDNATQVMWRQAQALVDTHRQRYAEAEQLAREAVVMDRAGDVLWEEGNSLCVLAEALDAAGRREEAIGAWQDALGCYERKGIIPLARRLRERLTEVQRAEA
jgi:tetratricopeptide (TPR) repeat protein